MKNIGFIIFFCWLFLVVSEIRCVFRIIGCNWEPIGKAECIYTAGFFTGTSVIIAWVDIEDK